MLIASNSSAQLVQLRQTIAIGFIDENRIGIRNVQTAFDDGRGQRMSKRCSMKSIMICSNAPSSI